MGEQICMKFDAEKLYKELSGCLGWTVLTTTSQENNQSVSTCVSSEMCYRFIGVKTASKKKNEMQFKFGTFFYKSCCFQGN
jgi:hypothetical protein